MNMRRFSRETQRNYIRDVGRFATFLGRSPHTATAEDVRRFQIEQRDAGVPMPTMNSIVSALRFFFTRRSTGRTWRASWSAVAHPRNLPVVLSRDEVARLLAATTCLKHQAALSVAYGAGLRVAEVAALKVADIDSERMLIRVERGKGGQYRNAMLPADLLTLLREWWRAGRQQGVMHREGWLFPGQHAMQADQHAATASRRRRCGTGGRDRQAGRAAHAAAQLRHPPARGRRRYPRHPGPARARQARQHRALHQGRDPNRARRDQPARQARHVQARAPENTPGGSAGWRCAPRSRSPTSSVLPGPLTGPPMPGT